MTRITLLAAALVALPACGKKTEPAGGGNVPDPAYTGSTAGPPGGYPPPTNAKILTSGWGDALLGPAKEQTANNLKQIGLAMHLFHDSTQAFPAGIYDKSGKALGLSWRVAILPFLEQGPLYKQFKLDEPWDSAHNKAIIPLMPKVYASPGTTAVGHTYYRGFTGKDMLFAPPTRPGQPGMIAMGVRLGQISDGTTNTALAVEAAEAVPWTKPDTLDVDAKDVTKTVGGVYENVFYVVRCDGSWTAVKKTITPATLRDFAVINDGNPVELPE
jgi:hypothetical protein